MTLFLIWGFLCVCFSLSLLWSKVNLFIRSLLIILLIVGSLASFFVVQDYLGRDKKVLELPSELIVYGFSIDREQTNILCQVSGEIRHLSFETSKQMQKALNSGRAKSKGQPFKLSLKGKETDGETDGKEGEDGANGLKSISLDSISTVEHSLPNFPTTPKQN